LHLAAKTMESTVEAALEPLLAEGKIPLVDLVKRIVAPEDPEVPALALLDVDLSSYDVLLDADVNELEEVLS